MVKKIGECLSSLYFQTVCVILEHNLRGAHHNATPSHAVWLRLAVPLILLTYTHRKAGPHVLAARVREARRRGANSLGRRCKRRKCPPSSTQNTKYPGRGEGGVDGCAEKLMITVLLVHYKSSLFGVINPSGSCIRCAVPQCLTSLLLLMLGLIKKYITSCPTTLTNRESGDRGGHMLFVPCHRRFRSGKSKSHTSRTVRFSSAVSSHRQF